MRLFRRAGHAPAKLPAGAKAAIRAASREPVLAWALDERDAVVAAGTQHLFVVSADGALAMDRPWHLVDAGRWDHDEFTLTVTWVDGASPARWRMLDPALLPETLRERVQATVVLSDTVRVEGRRVARVVIRRDLGSGDLMAQTLLARGVRSGDPVVGHAASLALADLKEQVGLA